MALDGTKEDDKTFDEQGITFIVNSRLYEQVKPINVDYVSTPMGSGFNISSNISTGSACSSGSCGSSCGS